MGGGEYSSFEFERASAQPTVKNGVTILLLINKLFGGHEWRLPSIANRPIIDS